MLARGSGGPLKAQGRVKKLEEGGITWRLGWHGGPTGAGLSLCPGKRTRPTRWRQGLTTGAGAEVTACTWVTAHEAAEPVLVSSSGHGAQESDPLLCPSTPPRPCGPGDHSDASHRHPKHRGGAGRRNLLGGRPTSRDYCSQLRNRLAFGFCSK